MGLRAATWNGFTPNFWPILAQEKWIFGGLLEWQNASSACPAETAEHLRGVKPATATADSNRVQSEWRLAEGTA